MYISHLLIRSQQERMVTLLTLKSNESKHFIQSCSQGFGTCVKSQKKASFAQCISSSLLHFGSFFTQQVNAYCQVPNFG
jgi:hypothetical protein